MTSGNSRVRRGLVVAQVTLCFLLLLAAGVFTRGLYVITGQMPAQAPHTLVTELRFDVQRNYGPAERRAFLDAFDARLRADGRVRGIAYTTSGPFSNGSVRVWRAGDPPEAGTFADLVSVGGDFDVSGVRVRRGRALTEADAATTAAAVVNEAFITDFQLAEPALGQSLRISLSSEENASPRHVTIVGVASAPVSPEIDDVQGEDPTIYLPLPASPDYIAAWISADNAALLTDSVRRTIADLDPEMPAFAVRTLEDHFEEENETLAMIARSIFSPTIRTAASTARRAAARAMGRSEATSPGSGIRSALKRKRSSRAAARAGDFNSASHSRSLSVRMKCKRARPTTRQPTTRGILRSIHAGSRRRRPTGSPVRTTMPSGTSVTRSDIAGRRMLPPA
ncbi:MAG: ABC transporter permease [Vicinamibacterales bacterium]